MKYRISRILAGALSFAAAFGWWGVLYPELTMTQDTYRIVSEEDGGDASGKRGAQDNGEASEKRGVQDNGDAAAWDREGNIYFEILKADRSKVRLRSGLLTFLQAYLEWGKEEEDP